MELQGALTLAGLVVVILSVLSVLRCLLGPTVPDRVVGLDTLNTLVVAAMVVFGAALDEIILVDVAIVYALLSFIGTLYIAKFTERGLS